MSHLSKENFSDKSLESWITKRRQAPTVDLTAAVMQEIRPTSEPIQQAQLPSQLPAWLVSSGCLVAGAGKVGLICHFAF